MIEGLILLSGHISSGKSTLAAGLADRFGMHILKTRDVLERRVPGGLAENRKVLQLEGERLDQRTQGSWVVDEVIKLTRKDHTITRIVVDSVRTKEQVQVIRKAFDPRVIHIHLTAPYEVLEQRYSEHKAPHVNAVPYAEALKDTTEQKVDSLGEIADAVIDSKRCNEGDVFVRATSYLKAYAGKAPGYVDVVIGGQYGSEGKGQIVGYLAKEYDLLVRVGGPNAGHQIYEEQGPFTHRSLPSGTRKNPTARILIGPGAVINEEIILKEIAECDVDKDRLFIDPRAMVISKKDILYEVKYLKGAIGSTAQGVGAATARRIRERYKSPRLAATFPNLKPFCSYNAQEILEGAFLNGERVLLEGTQGTLLSIYHGDYPHVTSRDTTVSACLSEAGVSPHHVRRIVMVCRTYPIRVGNPPGGTSGPMSHEIEWAEVERRAGYNPGEIEKAELSSVSRKLRRVAEFDWQLLHKSAFLNGPTDIALTFADYLLKENRKAKRFEQLDTNTINFVQEVEGVAAVPVSLIATGFSNHSVIDRRNW